MIVHTRSSHPPPLRPPHTSRTTRNRRGACRIANCLDFIEAWDQGFDTVRVLGFGVLFNAPHTLIFPQLIPRHTHTHTTEHTPSCETTSHPTFPPPTYTYTTCTTNHATGGRRARRAAERGAARAAGAGPGHPSGLEAAGWFMRGLLGMFCGLVDGWWEYMFMGVEAVGAWGIGWIVNAGEGWGHVRIGSSRNHQINTFSHSFWMRSRRRWTPCLRRRCTRRWSGCCRWERECVYVSRGRDLKIRIGNGCCVGDCLDLQGCFNGNMYMLVH